MVKFQVGVDNQLRSVLTLDSSTARTFSVSASELIGALNVRVTMALPGVKGFCWIC